jgi:ribosomal RNA-processing protein 17
MGWREERMLTRTQLRKQRQEQLEAHVEAVNQALRGVNGIEEEGQGGEDGEWEGIQDVHEIRREDEYVDEEKYTTVVVENVDITREGLENLDKDSEDEDAEPAKRGNDRESQRSKNDEAKRKASKGPPKKKKKKFRYENKEARKLSRVKERSRNSAQAEKRKGKK